ncbi:uncharacterized protein YbjT (DUF2867 family) [Fluviicoccus keumensis]|uniref:Uncharacterized protein YbjT (DUF2867 family) n=1 Tax=Fluviicoccus keumensis TaxID=1435465 RepID=A0A4Q7ZBW3_9GAMM|nr:NAD(P)H-binding protein [Fluviicoccus keumensis]RZU48100.1 uncharacterized protein YbjT (DUF2867 family) [Fluviicoccus keumensis]
MKTSGQGFSLLLAGSTGVVGQEVLRLALADPRVTRVVAPTRRPLPPHPKLENPVVDFGALPADAPWWHVDAVVCTLGTTIKVAGSQAAFAAIDRDLAIRMATLARQAGAARFGLNSSLGASPSGNFYLKTKAEAEAGIRALGYASYTIVRPSLIDAKRGESRLGEEIGLVAMGLFKPLVPKRYRAVKPEAIARALLEGVLAGRPGEDIVESERLQG